MSWKEQFSESKATKLDIKVGAWRIEFLNNGEQYETSYGKTKGISVHFNVNAEHLDTGDKFTGHTWVVYSKPILRHVAEMENLVGCVLAFTVTQSDPDDNLTRRYKDLELVCQEQEQLIDSGKKGKGGKK